MKLNFNMSFMVIYTLAQTGIQSDRWPTLSYPGTHPVALTDSNPLAHLHIHSLSYTCTNYRKPKLQPSSTFDFTSYSTLTSASSKCRLELLYNFILDTQLEPVVEIFPPKVDLLWLAQSLNPLPPIIMISQFMSLFSLIL